MWHSLICPAHCVPGRCRWQYIPYSRCYHAWITNRSDHCGGGLKPSVGTLSRHISITTLKGIVLVLRMTEYMRWCSRNLNARSRLLPCTLCKMQNAKILILFFFALKSTNVLMGIRSSWKIGYFSLPVHGVSGTRFVLDSSVSNDNSSALSPTRASTEVMYWDSSQCPLYTSSWDDWF